MHFSRYNKCMSQYAQLYIFVLWRCRADISNEMDLNLLD